MKDAHASFLSSSALSSGSWASSEGTLTLDSRRRESLAEPHAHTQVLVGGRGEGVPAYLYEGE